MSQGGNFFDRVYVLDNSADTRALYSEWAETYERDVRSNGYVTPRRTASAMAAVVADKSAPLLDIGCGTGLSGEALHEAGFATLDGTDFSEEMLKAAATKDIYRNLVLGDFNKPLPVGTGDYANFAAIGVFSPGHGLHELIDTIVTAMKGGECFGFSLNDHALEDPGYERTIDELVGKGAADLVFDEYGDHLTGLGSKSKVCVLKKR